MRILLHQEPDNAIEVLFRQYYSYLCQAVYKIIPDPKLTEDIAQEVFLELWKRKDRLAISGSFKAYLRRAARNKALNYLRSQRIAFEDREDLPAIEAEIPGVVQQMEAAELHEIIDRAIDHLPERCRVVFALSRFEDMTYQEIADQLEISVKTVENQISKALKLLRIALGPYTTVVFLLMASYLP